jgi:hypothetical protein
MTKKEQHCANWKRVILFHKIVNNKLRFQLELLGYNKENSFYSLDSADMKTITLTLGP